MKEATTVNMPVAKATLTRGEDGSKAHSHNGGIPSRRARRYYRSEVTTMVGKTTSPHGNA